VEQNRGPGYEPPCYAHLIFDKYAKIYNGEKIASSTNGDGKSGYLPAEN
jgi:hypothetical protein